MNYVMRFVAGAIVSLGVTSLFAFSALAERQVPMSEQQISLSYAPLVKQVAPAVVNVYARKVIQGRQRRSPFAGDPFFERFFGDQFRGRTRERVQNSLGSGVLVRADGIIVTNNHVIANGDEFTVVLADRREFDADVILQDERTDLAVLRIDAGGKTLPVLEFFDSDKAEVGDLVLAIGNPFGVGQTVTSGIVSATARTHVGISDYQFFIQTDAPINPGNSGGALVAMSGELLGVNTAIFSRSGGSNGIGFAIPANMVRLVVDSALDGGNIQRPWLGANGQTVTSDLADALGLERPMGVLINSLHKGGPAQKSGLKVGDIILTIAGFEVNDMQGARYRLATHKLGSKVRLDYLRDNKTRKTDLKLSLPPEEPEANETLVETPSVLYGVTVANLSPAYNELKGLDTMTQGVIVVGVHPSSKARRVGIRPGDIIRQINGEEIEDVRQVLFTTSQKSRTWALTVERGGRMLRVSVRG
jgi:Do/DeqQ family serine protease